MSSQSYPEMRDFPYWLVALIAIGLVLGGMIVVNGEYRQIFSTVISGIGMTLYAALIGFALATAIGLVIALMALSNNLILRQVSRFYVEIIRGIPILVILFYLAFVGAPALIDLANFLLAPLIQGGWIESLQVRDFSMAWRAIIALTICYGAFLSEIFRAGIQSIDKGQIDAAKALGLSRLQQYRLIILPQATRTIFPAWANDFIAILKDSSLVSILGVADMTQMAKVYSAGSFRFFETHSILAYIYAVMAITLAYLLRKLEDKLRGINRVSSL